MKTLKRIGSLVFLASTGLSVVPASATHAHLRFISPVTTTYVLEDRDGGPTLTVTWKAKEPAQNTELIDYEVTISASRVIDSTYSLLTLGFQAVDSEVEIKMVRLMDAGGIVMFVPKHGESPRALNLPEPIYRVSRKWDNGTRKEKVDGDTVSFLKLAGSKTFTFDVTQLNKRWLGGTTWSNGKTSGDGHENSPPKNPPD